MNIASFKALVRRWVYGPPKQTFALTSETVRWAYRLMLDREPENENVVQNRLERLNNVADLRHEFMRSAEFQRKNGFNLRPTLSGDEPRMPIDDVAFEPDIQRLFAHIQDTWQHFGETEPHWSVLAAEMFSQNNIEKNRALFYQSGQSDVNRFFQAMARCGIDPAALSSCLEYGCGVGRVTYWLAKRFTTVIGYDISRSHLQLAENYFKEQRLANITLQHLPSLADVKKLPKVDVVYSIIVLQHNPPPVMQMILTELIRCLNPGGVAFFQIPTYREDYQFRLTEYLKTDGTQRTMEMHVLPQSAIFEIIAREGARVVEVLEDGFTGSRYKEVSNTFLVQKR